MKRKVAKVGRLRLSPNEEAQIIKEEHERRRKLRLQQVREQERCIALQIRKEVQRRRDRELQNLADQLQEEWQRQQREKQQALEKLYQDSLNTLGESHRNAKRNEPDLVEIAQKAEEQHERAAERHREALRVLKSQRLRQQEEETRHIQARKKAMLVEKERAAKVASLPPPSPEPFEKIEAKKPPPVKMSDVDNFAVTHFHMPETAVDREEGREQPDARRVAEEEGQRLEELQKEEERERRERLAKARLRGSHALRKEHLSKDRERLLQELAHMQQADLLQRRQAVSQMPLQTFQPIYSRQERREDRQRDLEFAFEDMYTGERRMKGDLVVQLVPEPLPALSADAHDDELDVTLEPEPEPEPEAPPAAEQQAPGPESSLPMGAQAVPPEGAPPHALKKLLDRIRSQRSQWSNRAGGERAGDGMTIESGSLASVDRVGHPTPVPPHPDHPQPSRAPDTTEGSAIAGTVLPPQKQVDRISVAAEERRKRAEELEKQKQEQIELLQRLDQERRNLELQMQRAQLEKERLQTAAHGKPESSVPQEGPAPTAPTVCPETAKPESSAPDDAEQHSRTVGQYQQRLLDQNRQHRQSVEEARRRLAEYQHALKMRYSRALVAALNPSGIQNLPPPQAAPPRVPLPGGVLHRPSVPTVPSPAPTPLPPPTAVLQQGPAPVPGYGTMPNLHLDPSRLQSSDADIPSLSASGVPAQDPHQTQPTPLPCPAMAGEGPLPEPSSPTLSGTTLGPEPESPPALPLEHSPPPSNQLLPVHPSIPAPEPPGPAPVSTAQHGQLDRASPVAPVAPAGPGPQPAAEADPAELPETDPRLLELVEARQRVERQRSAVLEQQRAQEERLLLQQSQLREQMRRHREALDSFLSGSQASQSKPLEVSKEERVSLMSALLRVIEESNSCLPQPQSAEPFPLPAVPAAQNQADSLCPAAPTSDPAPQSDLRSRAAAHPRAPKPPLARPKLGILEIIEQHELSAIQEVETPIDASLATVGDESEVSFTLTEEPAESRDSTQAEEGQASAKVEHSSGSSTATGRSSRLSWRESLQMESGLSRQCDAARADNGLRPALTHLGLPIPNQKAMEEERASLPCSEERDSVPSEPTPAEAECMSSFTISTGSLSTNEPDFSLPAMDASSPSAEWTGRAAVLSPALRHCSSISSQGSLSPESLLANDSIQRIIDKYTKELNTSLVSAGSFAALTSPAGSSTAASSAFMNQAESSSAISLPWSRTLMAPEGHSLTSGPDLSSAHSKQATTTQNAQRSPTDICLEDTQEGFGPSGFMGSLEDVSKSSFVGARISSGHFLPLEPKPDFDSSASSSSRHSEGQEQMRRPQASQVTGHLMDQSSPQYQPERRDSTQSIGNPSAQSSSHWVDEGRGVPAMQSFSSLLDDPSSHLMGEEQLPAGEWEELSAGQPSGSFGEARGPFVSDEERGAQPGQFSEPAVLRGVSPPPGPHAPEAPPTLTQQVTQSSTQDIFIESSRGLQDTGVLQAISPRYTPALDDNIDADATLVDPTSDSFHPLPAEVTQNEVSETSVTFHLSEPVAPGDLAAQVVGPFPGVTTEAEDPDSTLGPPFSPEVLRAESRDATLCPPPSPASLWLVGAGESRSSSDSFLIEPLSTGDASLTGRCLDSLAVPHASSPPLPPDRACSFASAHNTGGPESLAPRTAAWERILEAGIGTGILEEPDLTLLSMTESSVGELTMEEEEEARDERKEPPSKEIHESGSLVEDGEGLKHESLPSQAVMLLEFQCPTSNLQQAFLQKRQDFIQRSARRLEELRARREETKSSTLTNRPKIRAQSQCPNEKAQPQLSACGGKLKKVGEVRVCTPEHRKTEEVEMYKRTERLYNQLEEVKQRKEIRSRQESYAKNREKAKEFQKKTLQKLRERQARH